MIEALSLLSLSFIVILCKSKIEVIGSWGQDCTPAQGDYPQACPVIGQELLSSNILKKIECTHNYDCCTCGKMVCGPDCIELVCNGDQGCFGVRDIKIIGIAVGALINCNGDVSCQNTGIYGVNIGKISCSGDNSCSYSIFTLECISTGCLLECSGDNSCESDPLFPTLNGIYTLTYSFGLMCAIEACKYSTFNLLTNVGGAILCSSFQSCYESMITVTNIDYLLCGGMDACKNANILIINPKDGFSIYCQSTGSCQNLKIDILITDPSISTINQISCGGSSSCDSINMKITKRLPRKLRNINNKLTVNELICNGNKSCFDGYFELSSNVVVSACRCAGGATNACDNIVGIDKC